jgi:hypothetical protein
MGFAFRILPANRYNTCMSDQLLRDWVETWARAGPELDAIRRREIAALTDEDIRQILQNLFSVPLPADSPARSSSGLVEQQRWFARLRQHR